MHTFKARIALIGINPFVFVPDKILKQLFLQAAKDRGHIPIKGTINKKAFTQTLVKYQGAWRLYINTTMLPKSPQRIGEKVEISIAFDAADRSIQPHPKLRKALKANSQAKTVFDGLAASKQKEIVKYIASLKTEESVDRNIQKAIDFLTGKGRFIGRDKP